MPEDGRALGLNGMRRNATQGILRIVLTYSVFAGCWILLSDQVLAWFVPDEAAHVAWSTYKGWAFVLVTAILLYGLLRRETSVREHVESSLRRANEALRESERRLSFALHQSRTGAWELDLVDHSLQGTVEHDQIFGFVERQPQWTYESFLEQVLPEDRPEVDRRFRIAAAARTDWNVECRIQRKDGAIRWIWVVGVHQQHGAAGSWGMTGVVQDITERKQAEHERVLLAETVEASTNEIYLFDAQTWRFRFVSAGAQKNLGYSLEQLRGMTPVDLKPRLDRASFEALVGPLLRRELSLQCFETVHRRANGSLYPVEVRVQLFESANDRVFLAVILDVTQRKEVESKLQQQLAELQRWHDATLGRESRILELKRQVNELLTRVGLPARYPSAESDPAKSRPPSS